MPYNNFEAITEKLIEALSPNWRERFMIIPVETTKSDEGSIQDILMQDQCRRWR